MTQLMLENVRRPEVIAAIDANLQRPSNFIHPDSLLFQSNLSQSQSNSSRACFAASTPLRTPWGSLNIENIRVGDLVLSRDENDPSGIPTPKTVEEVFVNEGLVWHLHVGNEVVRTSAEHPFFVAGRDWTPCNELKVGDLLLCEDGTWARVDDLLDTGECETLYNIRVADFHTYFVGCDEWGFSVWAHNTCIYHGTDAASAANIVAIGLNLANWLAIAGMEGDPKGFSLTYSLATATQWAATQAAMRGQPFGTVVGTDDSKLPPLVTGDGRNGFDPGEFAILPENMGSVGPGVFQVVVPVVPPLGS
jgi:Pretoxin HINT domain